MGRPKGAKTKNGARRERSTTEDRNRASRYRKRDAEFKKAKEEGRSTKTVPLSDDERAWLDKYTADHPRILPPPPVSSTSSSTPASSPAPVPTSEAKPWVWHEPEDLDEDDDQEDEPDVEDTQRTPPIKFEELPEPTRPAHVASKCTISDCPRCRAVDGSQVCGTTGLRVWPPLSTESSYSAAALLFVVMSLGVKVVLRQPEAIVPTQQELDQMAAAIKIIAYRRFPSAGQWDDLLTFGWATFAFVKRAATARPLPLPAPRPSHARMPPAQPPAASSPAPTPPAAAQPPPASSPTPPPASTVVPREEAGDANPFLAEVPSLAFN